MIASNLKSSETLYEIKVERLIHSRCYGRVQ